MKTLISKKISDLISYLVTEDQTELLEVLLILLQYSAECTGEIKVLKMRVKDLVESDD